MKIKPSLNSGERNGKAKLTDERVRAIRATFQKPSDIPLLAKEHMVAKSTIRRVVEKEIWRHVK